MSTRHAPVLAAAAATPSGYRRVQADAPVDVLATNLRADAPTHYGVDRPLSEFARGVEADIRDRWQALRAADLLSTLGVGNASRREPDSNRIVLGGFYPYTPFGDGVPRTVTIDLDSGRIVEGEGHAGLIEVAPLYVAVHRERPDITSIIHTHSPALSAFAVARRPFALRLEALLPHAGSVDAIPVTRWGTRYEPEPILDTLRAHPGTPALIHGNHGPFVFGRDIGHVFALLALLEEAAATTILSATLTPVS
jgi:ribulose-5-phosphate 4-epimerase/fuculose-1-phosphate aldolase